MAKESLKTSPQRIFVDATYTLSSGKNSGIERVVRSVIAQWKQLGSMGCIPEPQIVVSQGGKFFEASENYLEECVRVGELRSNILQGLPRSYKWLAKLLCQTTKSSTLEKWILPKRGHLGMFKLPYSMREKFGRRTILRKQQPITFSPNDLILLPDAYWINRLRKSVWTAVEAAKAEGAFVATVLYDLIPLTHPEYVGEKRRVAFEDYLLKASRQSDLMIAISQTVCEQTKTYLHEHYAYQEQDTEVAQKSRQESGKESSQNPNQKNAEVSRLMPDLRSFKLGSELSCVDGASRQHVLDAFSGTVTPYLMVSTFDPRKNHPYLLDAFDLLWQNHKSAKLCLVGRIGSRCDGVIQRILNHPLLNKNLFLIDDLSDAELQYCYRKCRGVIFPSIVEGFGLPIVEALWFQKKTFASDTPIHREVGGDACTYFDLATPNALVQEILQWESEQVAKSCDESSGVAAEQTDWKPTSWRESAEELLGHCLQASESARRRSFPLQIETGRKSLPAASRDHASRQVA